MTRILFIVAAMISSLMAIADSFSYRFSSTPMPLAILRILEDHPDLEINFIYNELENYTANSTIEAGNAYDAIRQAIGHNPITVVKARDIYYVEALQHGKYIYTGQVIGSDNEPVVAANVMLLSPKDSTVITYGITDDAGRFSIPCDKSVVLAKFSCLGYATTYHLCNTFSIGTIVMPEKYVNLANMTVEAERTHLYADRSIFLPTQRQKNASQTGTDLVRRLGIPQLSISSGDGITTTSKQPVDIFIDFQPATQQDLNGMRISDVKRVEYYDYPQDPRFQGSAHAINIVMQTYEYGGYIKLYGDQNLMVNSGQINLYSKLHYKKMIYDFAVGAFHRELDHKYANTTEEFRLPQADGSTRVFQRTEETTRSKSKEYYYWPTFRATYKSDKITMRNSVGATFDNKPTNKSAGLVSYLPNSYPGDEFSNSSDSQIGAISYIGNWTFTLPHNNTLSFNPSYSYTYTHVSSLYTETSGQEFENGAKDDTHNAAGNLRLNHSFGRYGNVSAACNAAFVSSRTQYSGTSHASDLLRTFRLEPGVTYNFNSDHFYGMLGVGLNYDYSKYTDIKEESTQPWVDMSLQYAFDNKNSINSTLNYTTLSPASSYRSATVILQNPLMSITGNPALKPYKRFDFSAGYTFMPSNNYSFSIYGNAMHIKDRYAFVYEASETGILRTVQQPMDAYTQGEYGINANTRLLDGSLQIGAGISHCIVHDGAPYGWTKSSVNYSFDAYYYVGAFNFGATYISPRAYSGDYANGIWEKAKDIYFVSAGWSNSVWNARVVFSGFAKWNWRDSIERLRTANYDFVRQNYGKHALIKFSATCTFGFGKKIQRGDEAYKQSGAPAGILK